MRRIRRGFAAIGAVLVMMAVLGALLFVAFHLSIGGSQAGLDLLRAERTLMLVEGCVEDALLSSKTDENFSGGEIVHPGGTCSVPVVKNGTEWTVSASAILDGFSRTIETAFDRQPTGIVLSRWQEIP